jgi:YVTN family beta-propeller protein
MKKWYFIVSLFFILLQTTFVVAEERAYVANWEADNISVIQTSNNTVMETISTDTGPIGLAFTPDHEYVYITNYGMATCNNKVTVIQTSDNTILTTITVGNCPAQIAITPDGLYGYVANYFSDSFSVIEISSNTVVATVTTGNGPMGVTITPDGQYAYFALEQAGTVQVVQTSDNTIVATIGVGSSPYRIAITPDGAYAYVTNRFSNNVSVIQTSNNTVIATIGVGGWPHGIAITPDGEYAYAVNFFQSNSVSVIQTSTNSVVNTISVGSAPKAIAFTPSGEYAYVTNAGSNSVSVIQTSTGTVVETISVNTNPSGIIIGNCPEGPGWIEGIVSLEGGAGDVEDVIVTAGTESTNPDATGFYSIEIEPGTYDVSATLDDYIPFNDSVTVVSGQIITVDIEIYCWDQIAPPENLIYIIAGDYLTWDPPQTALNWVAYNVYRNYTFIATIPDTTSIIYNPSPGIYFLTAIYMYGESEPSNIVVVPITGAEDDIISNKTELIGNYPNPFNPTTIISFNLTPEDAKNAELEIYNIKGQKVKELLIVTPSPDHVFSVVWDEEKIFLKLRRC